MDFQVLADSFFSATVIVSVEKKENGGYGDIRLVAANEKYIKLLDLKMKPNVAANRDGDEKYFEPGLIYSEYFQANVNFEDVCLRAAINKKEVHTYAHIYNVDIWFDI